MRKPPKTAREAVVRFLTSPFYWLFSIVYFVVSFPKRMRRRKSFRHAKKKILWRRLADSPVKALDASALILALRKKEQPEEFLMRRSPTILELLEMLWEEELSPCFRLPMVCELELVREEIAEDVRHNLSCGLPFSEITLWALDDHQHVFVGYCPFNGKTEHAFPEFFDAARLHKRPPNSQVKCFAYAVSVTALIEPSP